MQFVLPMSPVKSVTYVYGRTMSQVARKAAEMHINFQEWEHNWRNCGDKSRICPRNSQGLVNSF